MEISMEVPQKLNPHLPYNIAQVSHYCAFIYPKNPSQYTTEIFIAYECLLQLYSQELNYGTNQNVQQQR